MSNSAKYQQGVAFTVANNPPCRKLKMWYAQHQAQLA